MQSTDENAPVKEYEVFAVVTIPEAIKYRAEENLEVNYILPVDEYLEIEGEKGAMSTLIDVEDDKEAAFENWLQEYTNTEANFANTMVTSIIVRSRELAMLEAVGMTGVQQKRKLMKEGFAYFLWTVVVSVVISAIMSFVIDRLRVE